MTPIIKLKANRTIAAILLDLEFPADQSNTAARKAKAPNKIIINLEVFLLICFLLSDWIGCFFIRG